MVSTSGAAAMKVKMNGKKAVFWPQCQICCKTSPPALYHLIWQKCDSHLFSLSEPDSSKLSRSGGFRIKPSMKDSMALIQDTLEDPTSLAGGGGNGGRAGRGGATLQRRAGSSAVLNPFAKQQRQLTARIVAMGDDRVLGRLAKEYYFFRWGTFESSKDVSVCYIPLFHCFAMFPGNWDMYQSRITLCFSCMLGLVSQEKGSKETFSHNEGQPPVLLHPCLQGNNSQLLGQGEFTSSITHAITLRCLEVSPPPHLHDRQICLHSSSFGVLPQCFSIFSAEVFAPFWSSLMKWISAAIAEFTSN